MECDRLVDLVQFGIGADRRELRGPIDTRTRTETLVVVEQETCGSVRHDAASARLAHRCAFLVADLRKGQGAFQTDLRFADEVTLDVVDGAVAQQR